MRILSWNVNGLRSVHRKNFNAWFSKAKADFVCLQEIKAQEEQIPQEVKTIRGYYSFFNPAIKKGYSGVAVYAKQKPLRVIRKLGMKQFDEEGRILQLDYKSFTLINFYLPHGGRFKEKLPYKLEVYKHLSVFLKKLKAKNVILTGDFNIAHEEIDLARPEGNKNGIMFTPEERQQLNKLIDSGFTDTFRVFHKDGGHYSWWPYFANARARNLGWRIDYVFVSKPLEKKLAKAFILPSVMGSDHCPVGVDIEI